MIRPELQCKIQQVGSILFAASGFIQHKETAFDVYRTIRKAARNAASIDEVVTKFEALAFDPLVDALARYKKSNPTTYQEKLKNGTFGLILFTIKDGVPLAYARQYAEPDLLLKRILAIKTIRCPGPDCLERRKPFLLGRSEAITSFLNQYRNAEAWEALSLLDIARFFVTLEVLAAPDEVGVPIDLVVYDRSGIRWQRKPECEKQGKKAISKPKPRTGKKARQ